MKGVSASIQFLLFFVVGIGLFISISSTFRFQIDVFREDAATNTRSMYNSFASSVAVAENSCIACDTVSLSFKLPNATANYFFVVSGTPEGIKVASEPGGKSITTSVHNLASSLAFSGFKSSVETITLTLTKTQNKIEVK